MSQEGTGSRVRLALWFEAARCSRRARVSRGSQRRALNIGMVRLQMTIYEGTVDWLDPVSDEAHLVPPQR